MTDSPRWRVAPDAVFIWRQWDDEFVIYHENSGDTHRLHPVSARVLDLLARQWLPAHEIADRLGLEAVVSAASGAGSLTDLLQHLVGLGLIECDAPVVSRAV